MNRQPYDSSLYVFHDERRQSKEKPTEKPLCEKIEWRNSRILLQQNGADGSPSTENSSSGSTAAPVDPDYLLKGFNLDSTSCAVENMQGVWGSAFYTQLESMSV